MATSGSFSKALSDYLTVRVSWTQTKNYGSNSSSVAVTVSSIHKAHHVRFDNLKLTCFGQSYSVSSWSHSPASTSQETKTVFSKTFTVSHNSDGTKSGTIKLDIGYWFDSYDSGSNASTSSSVTLDKISTATTPTLSATSVNMGSSLTITASNTDSTYTHTLVYVCSNSRGSQSGTITTGLSGSYSWTVPTALATLTPNSKNISVTIQCMTYKGTTFIGQKSVSFTAVVPNTSDFQPTATVSVSDATTIYSTYGSYVKGKSKAKVTVSASGKSGATIASYKITANGTTYTTNPATTGFLSTTGTNTITVVVTDSRGYTKTVTKTITVIDYATPTISSMTAIRCNSSGTADDEGTYIKVTYTFAITSLNSKNAKSAVTAYKAAGSSSYTTVNTYTGAYSGTRSFVFGSGGISIDSSYNVKLTVSDDFTTAIKNIDVSSAFAVMDFRNTGKGIAVGQVSSKDRFQVGMIAELNKNVYLSPDSDIQKNILFENAGNETYKHNCIIYGGNGSSTTGIGFSDLVNSRTILAYNDVSNTLYTESILRNHFISVCLQTSTTISTTDETTLEMKTVRYEQDASGILSISGNGILCAKDGYILVSASVYMTTGVVSNGIYQLLLRKNSSGYIQKTIQRVPGTYHSISIPAVLCSVSAGDVITLGIKAQSGSGVVVNNGSDITNMSVMYVG